MLLEGLLAVLALATVMMLPKGSDILKEDPNLIYANGIAKYLGMMGINFSMAFPFALLAFSTFVYDTLDVSTRLARYILQELLGLQTKIGGVIATVITLAVPFAFLMLTREKGFMMAVTLWSLILHVLHSLSNMLGGPSIKHDMIISVIFGVVLFALSLWLIWEAFRVLVLKPSRSKESAEIAG